MAKKPAKKAAKKATKKTVVKKVVAVTSVEIIKEGNPGDWRRAIGAAPPHDDLPPEDTIRLVRDAWHRAPPGKGEDTEPSFHELRKAGKA